MWPSNKSIPVKLEYNIELIILPLNTQWAILFFYRVHRHVYNVFQSFHTQIITSFQDHVNFPKWS